MNMVRFPARERDFSILQSVQKSCAAQQVTGAISPGVKRQGRETNHSPPNVEVKNKRGYIFVSTCAPMERTVATAPSPLPVKYSALVKLYKFLKTGWS
jgi:hypothetical protein